MDAADRVTLLAALDSLGEQDRLVLTYRYFFELTEREMAQALACRQGTVKSRLSRALKRLRSAFAERAEDVPL
jgi:RNA polymerase sigma factor (sigma-70 family)